jgi:hypothetical protein
MILDLFSSSKVTREVIDPRSTQRVSGFIEPNVHVQHDGRSKIEQNEIWHDQPMAIEKTAHSRLINPRI